MFVAIWSIVATVTYSITPPSRAHRLLSRLVAIESHEVTATLLGFCWFACLLSGFYLLRPLRDAMGLLAGC